jgi:hypothetical protein
MKKQPKPNIGRLGPYTGPRGGYHRVKTKYRRDKSLDHLADYFNRNTKALEPIGDSQ